LIEDDTFVTNAKERLNKFRRIFTFKLKNVTLLKKLILQFRPGLVEQFKKQLAITTQKKPS